jgi:hypothetical protein
MNKTHIQFQHFFHICHDTHLLDVNISVIVMFDHICLKGSNSLSLSLYMYIQLLGFSKIQICIYALEIRKNPQPKTLMLFSPFLMVV